MIFHWVVDGLLVLIFLVGWAEATAIDSYCFTWFRFFRAASIPVVVSGLTHFLVGNHWWAPLLRPLQSDFWVKTIGLSEIVASVLIMVCGTFYFLFFLCFLLAFGVLSLTGFVVWSFSPPAHQPMTYAEETEPEKFEK